MAERTISDDVERAFPGRQLTHVLDITAADVGAAREVLSLVADLGAELRGLRMAPRGPAYELRVALTGLTASSARRLSDGCAALDGVTRAMVEHQLG